MDKSTFNKVYHFRKSENIVNQIYEALSRGDLKPNEKFSSEGELAEIFGVSKLTIREAIRSMEQMGIVDVRKGSGGGIFIKEMDIENIICQMDKIIRIPLITVHHITETRKMLERSIILDILPQRNISDVALNQIEDSIVLANHYLQQGKSEERLIENFKFHALITELTENPISIVMQRVLASRLSEFFNTVKPTNQMAQQTIADHGKILNAIKKGDFKKAADLSSSHIERVGLLIVEKSKLQSGIKNNLQRKSLVIKRYQEVEKECLLNN